MRKKLILFTVSFPYGDREQFLETELAYLGHFFEEIVIIPAFIPGKPRPLPENVWVDTGFAARSGNVTFASCSLLTKYLYQELLANPALVFSIRKLQKLVSFTGRGVALFRYLKRRYSADYVFYSYWFNGAVFASFLYDRKVHNISYVARAHGSDLYLEPNSGYLPLRRVVLGGITKLFPVSQNGYDYLQNHYRVNEDRIAVARLGTRDYGMIARMSEDQNSFHLVSCAHLTAVKRVDLTVRALAEVARKNMAITFVWTHIGDGPEYQAVKTLAQELLPDNVRANFPGGLPNSEVLAFYRDNVVDLFINTSRSEGIPVTFMEAMSCAIPVLALDVGGVSEIVNDTNGILLDKKADEKMIAKALHSLVNDKHRLAVRKKHARQSWETYYNADSNYTAFAKALSRLT